VFAWYLVFVVLVLCDLFLLFVEFGAQWRELVRLCISGVVLLISFPLRLLNLVLNGVNLFVSASLVLFFSSLSLSFFSLFSRSLFLSLSLVLSVSLSLSLSFLLLSLCLCADRIWVYWSALPAC